MDKNNWTFKTFSTEPVKQPPPNTGMIALVNLPVKVVFEWSDKIAADWDEEGNVLEYTSGYIMTPLPEQRFVHNGEEFRMLAQAFMEKQKP